MKNNACAKKKWCNITNSPKKGKKKRLGSDGRGKIGFLKYFHSVWTAFWSKDEEENDK